MEESRIYENIALRTGGDIYIGVVGPVRTGKSTFIKRFMETLVLPRIDNAYIRERARDELPQSASGRTVMTAEPKFVPEEAVGIELENSSLSVRLIDCVGFAVEGAEGFTAEDGSPRMISTPWFDHEIPLARAAETGTQRVITEHCSIGVVVTTDGSFTDIAREAYEPAEARAISELRATGKPFAVVLNSAAPDSEEAQALRREISEKYSVACLCLNCLELRREDVSLVVGSVLCEFPLERVEIELPSWIDVLPASHAVKSALFSSVRQAFSGARRVSDAGSAVAEIARCDCVEAAQTVRADLGSGVLSVTVALPRELFYRTLNEFSGFSAADDGDLLMLLSDMSGIKSEYERVRGALEDVRTKGYGIVMPSRDELRLEEPEIVRRGGRYGITLKASAPSIHMVMANIETEVSPAIGSESRSDDIIDYLLQEFEGDTGRIWESNIFGKSLYEIASEGLQAKIKKMPETARAKLQETLQRIVNEGSGGLICIIL